MTSRIMQTINDFLPETVFASENGKASYDRLSEDLAYFEKFINKPEVPDVISLISDMINYNIGLTPNLKIEPREDTFAPYYFRISGKKEHFTDLKYDLFGLEMKNIEGKKRVGTSFSIHHFGINMSGNREKHAKKGVMINLYEIPKNIANNVLKDFTKQTSPRHLSIFKLSNVDDIINCTGFKGKHVRSAYQKGKTPLPNVDENAIYTLEKENEQVSVYGAANGFKSYPSIVSMNLRIQVPDKMYLFPSSRF